jgi:DNA repair protein RadD
MLRPYQQSAHDAVMSWVLLNRESCVIDAATAAGKSHIIAAVVESLHKASNGKKVLCLAPSADLVIQNRDKYVATGNPASLYSASLGRKSLKHKAVFGTPVTVLNAIASFGGDFCAVIVDECHEITPTIKTIIASLQARNSNLRVIGLTATPYRRLEGYIYKVDIDGNPSSDDTSVAYFHKLVYRISPQELIDAGYITKPIIGFTREHYDTIGMQLNRLGSFDRDDMDRAYLGKGRKTAYIIDDIVEQAQNRHGVMIFAASIEHAKECMESLPEHISCMVDGTTPKKERTRILQMFRDKKIKYLVNRDVLTTGFDAPHVDLVALLRATESPSLLQQMIGRGLRLHPDKDHCLVLDYAENIARHCPDGDVFNPNISGYKRNRENDMISCTCGTCGSTNTFLARPNEEGYGLHETGYFTDLNGNKLLIPSHYGRRCQSWDNGKQCGHRWIGKDCESCLHTNDVAARFCEKCKHELVNPNDKLTHDRIKSIPVIDWVIDDGVSKKGNKFKKITYILGTGTSVPIWYVESRHFQARKAMWELMVATNNLESPPKAITYVKNWKTGFHEIVKYENNC